MSAMDDLDGVVGLGQPAIAQADGDPGPGVVFTPPHLIADSIKAEVGRLLGTVPEDKHFVVVTVVTTTGANAAIAYRIDNRLQVGAWIGKSGWDRPVAGGAFVKAAF